MKNIDIFIKNNYRSLISLRRYLHQNPEVGYNEKKTSDYLINIIKSLDMVITQNADMKFGFYTEIGPKSENILALRCDLDALPIHDIKSCEYSSKKNNRFPLKSTKNNGVNNFNSVNKNNFSTDPSRDLIFVQFEEEPSGLDKLESKKSVIELLEDREEFDSDSQRNITYSGFKNTKNNEEFLNLNSAIKFFDSFVFKSSLSNSIADKIYDLKIGEVYGPYNENGFVKATKLIDSKFIADSVKVRHILIPYLGSFRSGPEVFKLSLIHICRCRRRLRCRSRWSPYH